MMFKSSCKRLLLIFICFMPLLTVKADQCTATFSDGVTSNSSTGTITFGKNSMITGNPDTVLAAANVDSSSQGSSCQSADCTSGGSAASAFSLGAFQSTSSNTEVTIAKNGSGTIGNGGTNQYKLVKVEQGASLTVSSVYSSYKISELNIGKNAVVSMPAGEYWIDKLVTDQGMQINISGSGTIKLYINQDTTIGKNSQTNVSGSTNNMFIYTYNKFITEQGANVKAYVYVGTDATLGKNSLLTGSLSAQNIDFGQGAQAAFDSSSITTTDFGSVCTTTAPDVHHFEITHDGAGTNCTTDSITVKACLNADCSSLYTSAITADFQADGSTKKALDFTGSTTFNIAHLVAETLTFSIANSSKTATNSLVCSSGGGSSCDMVYTTTDCPVAGACAATYVDGLTNSDAAGKVKFQNSAYLTGNGDTVLATALVNNDGSATTCVSGNCSAGGSNTVVTPLTGVYVSYTSSTNQTVDGTTETISATDLQDVTVQNGGTLNMDSNEVKFSFRKLTITGASSVVMVPGDYFVEEFLIQDSATLSVSGAGTVRIFAKNKAQLIGTSISNGGSGGDASKLLLYFSGGSDDKAKLQDSAQFTGFIYSTRKVEVKNTAKVYGGISSIDELKIKNSAFVTARTSSAASVNYGDITCVAVGSAQCSATFPDGLNISDSGGNVKFQGTGRIIDNPDTVLDTPSITDSSSATTCGTSDCTASGGVVPALAMSFVTNTSSTNLTVNSGSQTIAASDYQDVTVKSGATFNMSGSFTSYSFAKLKVQDSSTVNMTAGDYYIADLEIKGTSYVNVIGSGTVRIWSKTKMKFKDSSVINGGSSGDASKLFLYYEGASGDAQLKVEGGAKVTGFLYSANKVQVKDNSAVYGAITSVNELKVKGTGFVTYKSSALASTDFGSACQSSTPSSVNHYRYEYDGSGLTCAAETITIKACANADCSTLMDTATTANFDVSTTVPSSAQLNLNFTGSTTVSLAEAAPTTITLSMSSPSPSASLQCYKNSVSDGSCSYSTTDTGFIFTNDTDGSQSVVTQLSGKPSNIEFNAKNYSLQAVQTDVNTGACAPLFGNGSTVAIELAYQCVDPSSCTGNKAVFTNNGNAYTLSEYPTFTSHNLLFAADSKAEAIFTYPEAGKIKIYAKRSVTIPDDVPGDYIKVLSGNTNNFVVRPFGFYMGLTGNPASADASGGVFTQAGQPFDITLTAKAWASGEDTNADGVPDNHALLSNNTTTLNFGQEASAEGVTITPTLTHPSGGINPAMTNNTFSSFSNGAQSKTGAAGMTWPEVGVITMTAVGDANYIDSGSTITTTSGNVGRFIPNHFRLLSSSLTQSCTNFSYMGQNFSLAFNVAAQGVGDIALSNYDSGSGLHGLGSFSVVTENSNNGTDLASRLSAMSQGWVDGVINQTFTPNFARLTGSPWLDGPFDNVFVGLQIADGDSGAVINLIDNIGGGTNMNALTNDTCVVGSTCDAMKLHASEVKFRYGRINSEQVFGPATESLTLPLMAEYFDGNSFITNTLDTCSTLAADEVIMSGGSATPFSATYSVLSLADASVVGSTTVDTTATNTSNTTLTAASGEFSLVLTAPSFNTGGTGYVPVSINLSSYPWLQFDWDTGGTGAVETTVPTQNVTFGQFRGNDRVIYWREKR